MRQVQVNPLSIKVEVGRKLAGAELAAFRAETEEIGRQLISLRQDTVVATSDAGQQR